MAKSLMKPKVDPVSGNEIPPGATAKEVRDDIPARLSEGEYVVPADVVKFYGVAFFEKLRNKAKEGMAEMERNGRVGGEPMTVDEAEEEYDEELPFSMDELETEDDDTDEQMKVLGFAEGGFVDPQNPVTGSMPNPAKEPAKFGVGFSLFGPRSGGMVDALTRYVSKTYVNDKGEQRVITFGPNGTPLTPIPTGFYEMGTTPPTQQEKQAVDNENWDTENDSRSDGTVTGEGGALSGWRGQDFSQFSEEDFMRQAEERLSGADKQGKRGAGIGAAIGAVTGLGLVAGVAGGLIGKGTRVADALGLANIAEEKGYVDTAEEIRARVSKSMEDEGFGTRTILDLTAKGNWYKKANYTGTGATPSAPSSTASRGAATASARGIDRSESTYAPAPSKATPAAKPADRTAVQSSGTQLSYGNTTPKGTATGTSTSASGRSTGTTGTPTSNTTPGGYSLGTPSKPAPRGGSVGAFNKGGLATKRKKK